LLFRAKENGLGTALGPLAGTNRPRGLQPGRDHSRRLCNHPDHWSRLQRRNPGT